jgi:hypothetical protein
MAGCQSSQGTVNSIIVLSLIPLCHEAGSGSAKITVLRYLSSQFIFLLSVALKGGDVDLFRLFTIHWRARAAAGSHCAFWQLN